MKKLNTIKIIVCLSTILVIPLDATRRNPNDGCWRKFCNAFNSCLRQTTRAVAISAFIIPGAASPLYYDNTPIAYNPTPGNDACEKIDSLIGQAIEVGDQVWQSVNPEDDPRLAIMLSVEACDNRNKALKETKERIEISTKADEVIIHTLPTLQKMINHAQKKDHSKDL